MMSKIYCYNKHIIQGNAIIGNEVTTMTEKQILAEYWEPWNSLMVAKYGEGHKLITKETCIDDWVAVNWAWEKPNNNIAEQLKHYPHHCTAAHQGAAEIERLEKENFELASWQCIYRDGKTGLTSDEYGNQTCAKDSNEYIHMTTPIGFLPLNSGSMRALVDKINEQAEKITMMETQLLIRRDRIESLKAGPGGIMEMKQTIANKEAQIYNRDRYIEYIGMSDDFEEFLSK